MSAAQAMADAHLLCRISFAIGICILLSNSSVWPGIIVLIVALLCETALTITNKVFTIGDE